jgi:hypothetical protein
MLAANFSDATSEVEVGGDLHVYVDRIAALAVSTHTV